MWTNNQYPQRELEDVKRCIQNKLSFRSTHFLSCLPVTVTHLWYTLSLARIRLAIEEPFSHPHTQCGWWKPPSCAIVFWQQWDFSAIRVHRAALLVTDQAVNRFLYSHPAHTWIEIWLFSADPNEFWTKYGLKAEVHRKGEAPLVRFPLATFWHLLGGRGYLVLTGTCFPLLA